MERRFALVDATDPCTDRFRDRHASTLRKGNLVLGLVSQLPLGLLAVNWSDERFVHAYVARCITFFAWHRLIAGAELALAGVLVWVQYRKPR